MDLSEHGLPHLHRPLDALEHYGYTITAESRANYWVGPYTYERPSTGHKVVLHYIQASPGATSEFSHWEHYGSNGTVGKSSTDEMALAPYLWLFHRDND